jgi:NAD(P)-dependent dehydrogenase (short-subunit alcohol dehydrogenase family)
MNIVVTGANKGLGLSLVKVFAENGHQVIAGVYGGDDTMRLADLAHTRARSSTGNDKITVIPMDVTDEVSVQTAAQKVAALCHEVDVMISNAGILMPGDRSATMGEMDMDELRRSLEVNTIGTTIVIKHFLPLIRTGGQGMMIFITSEAGSIAMSGANFPAYSISKAAANKAVFILRATVGEQYKIYAMHPGRMNTEMGRATAQIEPEESAEGIYRIATGTTEVDESANGFINYKGEKMIL